MKYKLIATLLVLVLLLAACGAPVAEQIEPATQEITTTEPTTTLVPREWSGVPQAYWAVLNTVQDVHITRYPTSYPTHFALADINGDGVVELVLAQVWDDASYFLRAIYTQHNDRAYNLATAPNHHLSISADGIVYTHAQSGSSFWHFGSERLEPNATQLTPITQTTVTNDNGYFTIGDPREPENRRELLPGEFYEIIVYGDNDRFLHYLFPPNPMQFNFIPLEQSYD